VYQVRLKAGIGQKEIRLNEKNIPFFIIDKANGYTIYLLRSLEDARCVQWFAMRNNCFTVFKEHFTEFRTTILNRLAEYYPIELCTRDVVKTSGEKTGEEKNSGEASRLTTMGSLQLRPVKKLLRLKEINNCLILYPSLVYEDDHIVNVFTEGTGWITEKEGQLILLARDKQAENNLLQLVASLHPDFINQSEKHCFYIPVTAAIKNNWLMNFLDKLHQSEVEIQGMEKITGIKYFPSPAEVKLAIGANGDWFDVSLSMIFGKNDVTPEQLKKFIQKGNRQVRLKDGRIGILSEKWVNRISELFLAGTVTPKGLRLSTLHFNLLDQFQEYISSRKVRERLNEQKERLLHFDNIKAIEVPAGMRAILRPYQKTGFSWLCFLHEFKWGGILADDMGLGKTLQVLTLLQYLYSSRQASIPSLLVAPTSLLFNWEKEAARFTPGLRVQRYHGQNRELERCLSSLPNVILTSYGIIQRDIHLFANTSFHCLLLDEAQAIKNPSSKRFKATSLLKAEVRLALTGTPIENSLNDLYALLSFVNPGFWGSYNHFKANYLSGSIGRDNNLQLTTLQKMVRPFILRRTKAEVAKDLPEKTETVLYVQMEEPQLKIYHAVRERYRSRLMNQIDEIGLQQTKIYLLEGLLRLRQVCNSPALLNGEEKYKNHSAKLDELMEHLMEINTHHKVLVFSQFTGMLQLIRERLETVSISYAYLDGQTKEQTRQTEVEKFQEEENCRVFLISLKAGGTGLNLTAADYVYLVDPWWNPAAEAQAIDRCYRIGQDKHVIAYRMICKGTIEEKMLNMQASKKQLSGQLLASGENIMSTLTKEDIVELFSGV
jgi:superfamily II DNA or RNA helicase